jgi:hypothetical protein
METALIISKESDDKKPEESNKIVLPNFRSAEVTGIVSKIVKSANRNEPTKFKIYCPNIKKYFDAVCSFYCPLIEGDTIYAFCILSQDNVLHVSRPPFVQPAIDKNSTIQCFMRAMRQGFFQSSKIYEKISKIAGDDESVIPFLSSIAQVWNDKRDSELLFLFENSDPDDIKKLLEWWYRERNLRRLYLFGLSRKDINACRMSCEDIYNKCLINPYTIPAIPIEKCDSILERLNKTPSPEDKYLGIIIRIIWKNLHGSSWVGTPTRFLAKQFPGIKNYIPRLKNEYGLVAEMETAYLNFPHKVEDWLSTYISEKVKNEKITYDTPVDVKITFDDGEIIERKSGFFSRELSEDQQKAVQGALDHKICIIKGGAGTGKTTTLGQIINNLELRGVKYAVCSFTGKAVSRIREVTKKRCPSTIHRLIANAKKDKLDKKYTQFEKDTPLSDFTHLVIDESSTVCQELAYDLLLAYPNIEQLTLIGDPNQLEPIGSGAFFNQIVKSETIPTYELSTNYRVYTPDGEKDGIILNANALINHNPNYPFEYYETNNFSLIEGPVERVYDIIQGCFAAGIKPEQLVIITPYNRYIDLLNSKFREIYNKEDKYVVDSRNIKWMIGDRVMLTENISDIGVFNGESGTIKDITEKAVLVDFGNSGCHEFLLEPDFTKTFYKGNFTRKYNIRGKSADEVLEEDSFDDQITVKKLIHCYCITVDKSQGSEWDFVIFFIPEFTNSSFINRNRIYTALTRAKRCVWCVVSDIQSFNIASIKPPPFRCENLYKRLQNKLPNLKPFKLNSYNPLLEMNGNLMVEYEPDFGYDSDDFE